MNISSVEKAASLIDKQFGGNSKPFSPLTIEGIPTGIPSLDRYSGVGGWPRGFISQLYGAESAGKTTLALEACAQAQAQGLVPVYFDTERVLEAQADYMERIGVNLDAFVSRSLDSAEDYFEAIQILAEMRAADLIVLDSSTALRPGAPGARDEDMALLMSNALRALLPVLKEANIALLVLSQMRYGKTGRIKANNEPEWELGAASGKALAHYSVFRVETRAVKDITLDSDVVGSVNELVVHKNKVGAHKGTIPYKVFPKTGVYVASEALKLGKELGLVKLNSKGFSYKGINLGKGVRQAANRLHVDAGLLGQLYKEVVSIRMELSDEIQA